MTKTFEEEFEQELDYFIERELSLDEKLSFGARDVLVKFFSGWHSPEHIAKEIQMQVLKSQHQPLPEVPEFVAGYIETKLDQSKNLQDLYDEPLFHTGEVYLSGSDYDFISWFNENTTLFEQAWVNGYTVQKPKLFYLKNKLTGKYLNFHLGNCEYEENGNEYHHMYKIKFTQEEIDSMQTGSYEKIPVEMSKNG